MLNYAMYPLAAVHGIGAASDLQSGALLLLTVVCLAVLPALPAGGW